MYANEACENTKLSVFHKSEIVKCRIDVSFFTGLQHRRREKGGMDGGLHCAESHIDIHVLLLLELYLNETFSLSKNSSSEYSAG